MKLNGLFKKKINTNDGNCFMTKENIDAFNKAFAYPFDGSTNNKYNMILSDELALFIDNHKTNINQNVFVVGGSGSGMSFRVVAPNLLKCNSNYVVTDPSGELYHKYAKYLENNGYTIKVLNLDDIHQSNKYNPLKYIYSEKDIFYIIDTLIKSNKVNINPNSGNKFWLDTERLLLQSVMLYLWHTKKNEIKMTDIVELINQADVDEKNPDSTQSELDKKFASLENENPDNLAVKQYKAFKKAAGKTIKSIIVSTLAELDSFMMEDIQYLTSNDEMDFEHFGDSKQALFVIISSDNTMYNHIVSLAYTQLIQAIYKYGEERAQYSWKAIISENDDLIEKDIIKVAQARNSTESVVVKDQIKDFVNKILNEGLTIRENKDKNIFEIITKDTVELVSWRGTKDDALLYIEDLKRVKAVNCDEIIMPNHVQFYLNEFTQCIIPEIDKYLATMRKYNTGCTVMAQSVEQIEALYGNATDIIIGNCDVKICLGCHYEKTIKFFSDICGKRYIENKQTHEKISVKLVPTDKIAKLDNDSQCIIILPGQYPYFGSQCKTNLIPEFDKAMSTAGIFIKE